MAAVSDISGTYKPGSRAGRSPGIPVAPGGLETRLCDGAKAGLVAPFVLIGAKVMPGLRPARLPGLPFPVMAGLRCCRIKRPETKRGAFCFRPPQRRRRRWASSKTRETLSAWVGLVIRLYGGAKAARADSNSFSYTLLSSIFDISISSMFLLPSKINSIYAF